MLSPMSSNDDPNVTDLLYHLCKDNEIEKVRKIIPFIDNINIINKFHTSTGSTCLHVACYYGHQDMVQILLEYGALPSIRNLRHNLTPYEEACTDNIKKLFIKQRKLFANNNYNYIEWSMIGKDLLGKRREFRQAIDLYKTYDNYHLVSKLLAEVIHYYLNEYLINESNDNNNPENQITRKQIETIEACFKEAIEKQDYLTYFIKAYSLTNIFYKVLNRHLALYVLDYFDTTKHFSSNYRLVNCLIHIVTLLIYHPNLHLYRYQGLCYRGMRITQNDLDQYQLNQHILNRSFLSTSIDRKVAEMFAGEGQQSQMRHTPRDHCALQYSCLCQYLIKQNYTAVNIESLSTRPDEKEILIIPFSVFRVIAIKRNYLDDLTAPISIEIVLEECEDESNQEILDSESSTTPSLLSSSGYRKHVGKFQKFKQRKHLLYSTIGFSIVAILLALTFTMISIFAIKKNSTKIDTNSTTSAVDKDNEMEYSLPSGKSCPSILNRSNWDARPYISREGFKKLPVTHIVLKRVANMNSTTNQQDCITKIKNLQNLHMDTQGWADIGYHFFLCSDNNEQLKIYRGRGWTYVGAHCLGYNFMSLGIGIMGNYSNINTLNTFKSLIQCGIKKNVIAKNFTLVADSNSAAMYQYYLKYFRNDTDLHYSNQASNTTFFCE